MKNYVKRAALSTSLAFLVLMSYTLSAIPITQINADRFVAMIIGSLICCLMGGFIAAALVRRNDLMMLIVAQLVSVITLAVFWRL